MSRGLNYEVGYSSPEHTSGIVSCVYTNFWVDHTEPLEALGRVRETTNWPLGDLHDGHEFLLIIEARRST